MSSENREEILVNFQSIAGIDDVAMAIYHLEESNWDLYTAVNRVLPPDNVSSTTSYSAGFDVPPGPPADFTAPSSPSNHMPEPFDGDQAMFDVQYQVPGPSTSRANNGETYNRAGVDELSLNVHFNGRIFKIKATPKMTIKQLKERIQEETLVPVCRQALKGWRTAYQRIAQDDETILRALNLEPGFDLFLTDLTQEGFIGDMPVVGAAASSSTAGSPTEECPTYTLHITLQPGNKERVLKFPGKHTVLGVKTDLYTVTSIPVRHQVWIGWPNGIDNMTTLAESGIALEHRFELRSGADDASADDSTRHSNNSIIELDSDSEEFEDAAEDFNAEDDILFAEAPIQQRQKHLIPDATDNEQTGVTEFIRNYIERYGPQHPIFFEGPLDEALKEACHKSPRERKLLAVYLHHDRSVLTNVFCGQLMSHESIIHTFLEHFVLYGWDLTNESNKNLFLSSISACVGVTASITVRNIRVEQFPAIIIIAKTRSVCDVVSVIYGNIGVDDLLTSLMEATEMYSGQLAIEIREEDERLAREQVKLEQDAAYRESLEADRAKEEARRQKEMMIANERKRLEPEKAELEAKKESIRSQAEKALPPEPEGTGEKITCIRVRKPTGDYIERRFTTDTKLQALLNFVTSKGFPVDEYKVVSSWPRKDLTDISADETFQSLKLYPNSLLILEER